MSPTLVVLEGEKTDPRCLAVKRTTVLTVCSNILSVPQRTLVTTPRTLWSDPSVFRNRSTAPLPLVAVWSIVTSTWRRLLAPRLWSRCRVALSLDLQALVTVTVSLCLSLIACPVLASVPACPVILPSILLGNDLPTRLPLVPSSLPLRLTVVHPFPLKRPVTLDPTSLAPLSLILSVCLLPLVTLSLSLLSCCRPLLPSTRSPLRLDPVPLALWTVVLSLVLVILPLVPIRLVLRPRPVRTKLVCLRRLPFASLPESFSLTLRYLVKSARTLSTVPLLSP